MKTFRLAFSSVMKTFAIGVLALGGLCTTTPGVQADTFLTWNVTATFDDGATLSGFFGITEYGYTNGTNWSLTTTAGTTLTGYSYSPGINALNPNVLTVQFTPLDYIYQVLLQLTFANSLLVPSANNPLVGGTPGPSFECLGWGCQDDGSGGTTRYIGEGYASSAVPLPAALPLFAGGLGLLGWMARRKRKQAAHA